MRDIRIQDSPYRAAALHYLTCAMALALATSVCLASVHASLIAWMQLSPGHGGQFLTFPDLVLRIELLPLLGVTQQATYRFMSLARSGLAIDTQVVAASLLRSTSIYAALALPVSAAWLAGKHLSGDNWWCLLYAFGGYQLALNLVGGLLSFESPAPVGGRGVMSIEQARAHVGQR